MAISAGAFDAKGLAGLRSGSGTGRVRFDLGEIQLRAQEHDRLIENIAVLLVGPTPKPCSATLRAACPPRPRPSRSPPDDPLVWTPAARVVATARGARSR